MKQDSISRDLESVGQTWKRDGRKAPLVLEPCFRAGHHEPLIFRRRLGRGCCRDGLDRYLSEHTEANARRLKAEGVNWARVHYFKGFGLKAEAEEMAIAKKWIGILHGQGLKAETYLQFSNTMYETFLEEEPEAKGWIQITQEGVANRLCYDYMSWRYMMCYNNEGWHAYLKKVVRQAILDAGTDQLAWDNYDVNFTPDFCYCAVCREKFIRYVESRYPSDSERLSRYGFVRFKFLQPPVYTRGNDVERLRKICDPLIQDWIDFVSYSKAEALNALNDYGRALKRDLTVNCNATKGASEDVAFTRGVDIVAIAKTVHLMGSEEGHAAVLKSDGTLVNRIRTYKMATALGMAAGVSSYAVGKRGEALCMAEAAAFSLAPRLGVGILEKRTDSERWRLWDFLHERREFLSARSSPARIAVLRGTASMRYNRDETYWGAMQVEQVLIQNRMIFQIVADEHLDDLGGYRLLMLPNTEAIGEKEAERIRSFARNGGHVLAIGSVGVFDDWRRILPEPRFRDLEPAKKDRGGGWTARVGKGVFVYLPRIEPSVEIDFSRAGSVLPDVAFGLPKNERQILRAIRSFGKDVCGIWAKAPRSVALEWWQHGSEDNRSIHVVNYDASRKARNIAIEVEAAPGCRVRRVIQFAPEMDKPRALAFTQDKGLIRFRIPVVDLYTIVCYG